jgi:UDP-glucose 4-epimerase
MKAGMDGERVVLVTGACGWIGRNVCARLKGENRIVIACDLREQDGPWDQFIDLDISSETGMPDRSVVNQLPDDAAGYTLIHCAGYAHRPIETPLEVRRFFAINADGTRRVVDWARAIGVKRLLYVSSIAFYDWISQQGQLPLSEAANAFGRTAYAKSKLDGEQHVRACGLDSRIVRLATVFGKGDRANFAKLARALKTRRFILPGEGAARKSVISVEKASEWIAEYALMDQPRHRLINLGFQQAPTLKEICEGFAAECAFPRPRALSVGTLQSLARVGDVLAKFKPNFPLTTVNVGKLTQSTWVDCSKAVELFPEAGRLTFAEALRDSKQYYQSV